MKKSLDPNWQHEKTKRRYQHKKTKHRRSIFAQKGYNNSATWQVDNQKKLITEVDRDFERVLSMIQNRQKIYIEYFDQANKADNQYGQIQTNIMELE